MAKKIKAKVHKERNLAQMHLINRGGGGAHKVKRSKETHIRGLKHKKSNW